MAPRLQPASLLTLSHQRLATDLADICRFLHSSSQDQNRSTSHVLNIAYNKLRPFWQETLPACIRAKLLEETTSLMLASDKAGGGCSGAAQLYLLVLLLAKDIQRLRVELCCYYGCMHQSTLLKFLAIEGTGLISLELARSTLLRLDEHLLHSVLTSASSLRYLTLRNIANDNVMKIVGDYCHNLVSLDVSHSKEVTDAGLKQLFLKIENSKSIKKISKINTELQIMGNIKKNISQIFRYILRVCGRSCRMKDTFYEILGTLNCFDSQKSICSTMKYLNIANTGITNHGILLVLYHVKNLESVGEYCHIGKALELIDASVKFQPIVNGFHLKCVNSVRTTQQYLNHISQYFVHLQKLTITEPRFLPKSLFNIPRSITSLTLQSIPSTDEWLETIQEYLHARGNQTQELFLRFLPGDILPSVSLDEYFRNCPNLRSANIDGASIKWKFQNQIPIMNHLWKIQLGKVVSLNAICQILKTSPNLGIIHVFSCDILQTENLFDLSTERDMSLVILSKIKCFYIYETVCLNKTTWETLIQKLPAITKIGNIKNCALSLDEVTDIETSIRNNNFETELSCSSHWFSSSCFPL